MKQPDVLEPVAKKKKKRRKSSYVEPEYRLEPKPEVDFGGIFQKIAVRTPKDVDGVIIRTKKYFDTFLGYIDRRFNEDGLIVFTAGSADDHGKIEPSRMGYIIYKNKELLEESAVICEENPNTSTKAEILAIVGALRWLLENGHQDERIFFFGSNLWVIEWCLGDPFWQSKSIDAAYYGAFAELRELMHLFADLKCAWIPSELNQDAKGLTKDPDFDTKTALQKYPTITFGKYKGTSFETLLVEDSNYLHWLSKIEEQDQTKPWWKACQSAKEILARVASETPIQQIQNQK